MNKDNYMVLDHIASGFAYPEHIDEVTNYTSAVRAGMRLVLVYEIPINSFLVKLLAKHRACNRETIDALLKGHFSFDEVMAHLDDYTDYQVWWIARQYGYYAEWCGDGHSAEAREFLRQHAEEIRRDIE